MMDNIEKLLKDRPIIVPRYLFNYYLRLGITAEELIVLIFIIDKGDMIVYNPEEIAINLGMDKFKVMEILSSLDEKKIISIALEKNSDGKSEEYISLDLLYKKIVGLIIDNKKEKTLDNSDIFSTFENEFGRPISSMECQIIKGWIDDNFSHELIMEALKEEVQEELQEIQREIYKSEKGLDILNSYRDEIKTKYNGTTKSYSQY